MTIITRGVPHCYPIGEDELPTIMDKVAIQKAELAAVVGVDAGKITPLLEEIGPVDYEVKWLVDGYQYHLLCEEPAGRPLWAGLFGSFS